MAFETCAGPIFTQRRVVVQTPDGTTTEVVVRELYDNSDGATAVVIPTSGCGGIAPAAICASVVAEGGIADAQGLIPDEVFVYTADGGGDNDRGGSDEAHVDEKARAAVRARVQLGFRPTIAVKLRRPDGSTVPLVLATSLGATATDAATDTPSTGEYVFRKVAATLCIGLTPTSVPYHSDYIDVHVLLGDGSADTGKHTVCHTYHHVLPLRTFRHPSYHHVLPLRTFRHPSYHHVLPLRKLHRPYHHVSPLMMVRTARVCLLPACSDNSLKCPSLTPISDHV
jgi:hypothetical protein